MGAEGTAVGALVKLYLKSTYIYIDDHASTQTRIYTYDGLNTFYHRRSSCVLILDTTQVYITPHHDRRYLDHVANKHVSRNFLRVEQEGRSMGVVGRSTSFVRCLPPRHTMDDIQDVLFSSRGDLSRLCYRPLRSTHACLGLL
jgi:hypothetical protein